MSGDAVVATLTRGAGVLQARIEELSKRIAELREVVAKRETSARKYKEAVSGCARDIFNHPPAFVRVSQKLYLSSVLVMRRAMREPFDIQQAARLRGEFRTNMEYGLVVGHADIESAYFAPAKALKVTCSKCVLPLTDLFLGFMVYFLV